MVREDNGDDIDDDYASEKCDDENRGDEVDE